MEWSLACLTLVGIPVRYPNSCGHSTAAGAIWATLSLVELSTPLDVQWHGLWLIELFWKFMWDTQILVGEITPQLLVWFVPSQVIWKCLRPLCHHKLWPTSVIHPYSFLNSSLGLAGGITRKLLSLSLDLFFKILFFWVAFLLFCTILLFLLSSCYYSLWL